LNELQKKIKKEMVMLKGDLNHLSFLKFWDVN